MIPRARSSNGLRLAVIVLSLTTACSMFTSLDAKRGDQHLAAQQWEEASVAYKEALKTDPFDESLQEKYALARDRAAAAHEERGRQLLKEGQIDGALEAFKRALAINPSSLELQAEFAEALRLKDAREQLREAERLSQLGRTDEAMGAYARAVELDPSLKDALEGISKLTEEQQALHRDDRRKQPVTLKFRNAGIKEVLEGLGKAAGVSFVFDKDVRNDPITVSIEDKPFDEALNFVLNSNNLFAQAAKPDLYLVSPNTKQKQEQYQDQLIRTFYLSHVKAKDMLALLKTMLESKRMHANEQVNTIVIRDQPEKVELAEKIILANDRPEPEVLFDVEVLEVNRNKNQTYGLNYPKQAGAALVPPGFTGLLAADPQQFTYRQLTSLGEDSYLFRLPTTVLLDYFKQESDAKTLAAPKVRVVNNKKAEINIGDKQPILLSTTNVLPGQAATGAIPTTSTVTSIEFRDTGVKLTVEPSIRLANELTLKMKIEVIRIGDLVTLQANPPIQQFRFGNRSAETILSIKDGETIVLGGLIQEEDRRTRTTIPWIGDIPLLGNLLSSFRTERITTEVILTITPRIVQPATTPGAATQVFWSGTESMYATKPLFSTPVHKTSLSIKPMSRDLPDASGRGESGAPSDPGLRSGLSLPQLGIEPADLTAQVGKEFSIAITGRALARLKDNTIKLTYDQQIIEFRSAEAGDLLRRGGPSGPLVPKPPADGVIELNIPHGTEGFARDGILMRLTFAGKVPGVSPLRAATSGRSEAMPEPRPEAGTGFVRVR